MSLNSPESTSRTPAAAPIDPIRVEPLSAQMPIHQLAKRGREEIRIIERKIQGGQVSLYWKVEPNLNVGWPGQLAYHLDTLVIKRRLDQLRRPLPRLIRVGDLREIARELNHGGDTSAIKRAFEQNTSVFIRAKIEYRTRDQRLETIEGYFNRYNVFYRGQSLPGGRAAETVYISLNDPYYGMLNSTAWRPLDYAYLKGLAPAAQRFYELVSPRIFATLKNRRPEAWSLYSDYCRYAVQKRHLTRRRMQIQMAVIHRPHLKSGYLAHVSYRPAPSEDGVADWFIHYTPGPRARAEYRAFNPAPGFHGTTRTPRPATLSQSASEDAPQDSLTPDSITSGASPAEELARRFYRKRHGLESHDPTPNQVRRAEALIEAAEGDVEMATTAIDFAVAASRQDPRGYPGHIGGVLEGDYLGRARQARDAENLALRAKEDHARNDARRHRYDAWCRRRAEERIKTLSEDARRRLIQEQESCVLHDFRYYLVQKSWTDERIREWVAAKILNNYGKQGEPSYADWVAAQDAAEAPPGAHGPPLQ